MNRALWLMALAACAGDAKDAGTGDTADTDAPAATFSRVREEILVPSCALSGCHGEGAGANGMELASGQEHAALVNASSIAAPGEILVVPGDADTSYVVDKLEGAVGIVGTPMPYPIGGLDEDLVQLMRDWIDAGALDN